MLYCSQVSDEDSGMPHIPQPPEGIKFCVKNNAISTSAAQQWASSNGTSRDERKSFLLEVTDLCTRVS
jgi:hypothetical protein